MTLHKRSETCLVDYPGAVTSSDYEKPYRLTRFIASICDSTITSIDIKNILEIGLHIVRFKLTSICHDDRVRILGMIKEAVHFCCEKYDTAYWPIAISIDVPNCIIKTGILKREINENSIYIKEESILEITSNINFYNKCDRERIYIDDPYMIKSFEIGMEMSINFGEIVMHCTEILSASNIRCRVYRGGWLRNADYVCVRGAKHTKPILTKRDLEIIEFAKTFKIDILTVNSVRTARGLKKIKKMFNAGHVPLFISTICEQEGLDNIDDIIRESDGIILAREFLANEIINKYQMVGIQLHVTAKCRMFGKPLFMSGNILEQTLIRGRLTTVDISDVTNIVLQGAGLVLRDSKKPANIMKAIHILTGICKSVEPLAQKIDFWRLHLEFPIPINAAESCVLGCALASQRTKANVIVLLTVSGKTCMQLVRMAPLAVVVAVVTRLDIANKLHMYRGIIPLVYDDSPKENFHSEMEARVQFAVDYSIKTNLLNYGDMYVTLQRSLVTSAYCDMVCCNKVFSQAINRQHLIYNPEDQIE